MHLPPSLRMEMSASADRATFDPDTSATGRPAGESR